MRFLGTAVLTLALAAGLNFAAAGPTHVSAGVRPRGAAQPPAAVGYRAPVAGPLDVERGFDAPASRYGPGHLGVDLRLAQRAPVLAAAPGVVTFAGQVAGRGVVVVAHPDGIRTEYEPVTPSVRRGDEVAAGTPVGVLSGRHPGCPVADCLHWGARRGTVYLDPLSLLRPLGPVRLLPW